MHSVELLSLSTMLVSCETRGELYTSLQASEQLNNYDTSFKNMSDKEWDQIMEVHLKGAFACTKAAWPHFRKQKFGRVVNTASAAGIYGR